MSSLLRITNQSQSEMLLEMFGIFMFTQPCRMELKFTSPPWEKQHATWQDFTLSQSSNTGGWRLSQRNNNPLSALTFTVTALVEEELEYLMVFWSLWKSLAWLEEKHIIFNNILSEQIPSGISCNKDRQK